MSGDRPFIYDPETGGLTLNTLAVAEQRPHALHKAVGIGLALGAIAVALWRLDRRRREGGQDRCTRCRCEDCAREKADHDFHSPEALKVRLEKLYPMVTAQIAHGFRSFEARVAASRAKSESRAAGSGEPTP